MYRGWELEYSDGTIINEEQMEWKSAPKLNIVRLTLRYDGREWNITDKLAYTQKKRASMIPGIKNSFQVESRSIGYYDNIDGKDIKVWYTVDEESGRMTMSVEEL
jgi:hypothetical protein